MAHRQQLQFIQSVSEHLSDDFSGKNILEIGSYDVNGSIRQYFTSANYVGVDLTEGPGVDIVCEGDKLSHPDENYELTVSCECFEHNPQWSETFVNMYRMTKPGGILIFTCATTGRVEHGTTRTSPESSPGTQDVGWDYYLNLKEKDFKRKFDFDRLFKKHFFLTNKYSCDLYFFGVKCGDGNVFDVDIESLKDHCILNIGILQDKISAEEANQRNNSGLLRGLKKAIYLPLIVASFLPDRNYQNVTFYYNRFLIKIYRFLKYIAGFFRK